MVSAPEIPASPLFHLIDEESSLSEKGLISRKRSSVDVGDGTIRADDSSRGYHESTTIIFEVVADLPFEVPLPARTVEGVPFHDAEVRVSGPPVEIMGTVL